MGMARRAREGSTKVIPNPPMPHAAVSVAIVVRAWESHVQGEGPHRERCASSNPAECKGLGILQCQRSTKSWKSFHGVAVCGESRTHGGNGGDGKTQFGCASCPYPLILQNSGIARGCT